VRQTGQKKAGIRPWLNFSTRCHWDKEIQDTEACAQPTETESGEEDLLEQYKMRIYIWHPSGVRLRFLNSGLDQTHKRFPPIYTFAYSHLLIYIPSCIIRIQMAKVARKPSSQQGRNTSAGGIIRKGQEQLHELKGNMRLRFQEAVEVCRYSQEG